MKTITFIIISSLTLLASADDGDIEGSPLNQPIFQSLEREAVSNAILETIKHKANGDPEKLKATLEELQRDPSSIQKYVNDDQKKLVNKVSEDMEKSKKEEEKSK